MLKEVEELRTPCKKIDYCSSYKKIISDEMREKYCRLREEVCCKQNGFIGGIFLLQEIVMQNDYYNKRLFQNSLNPSNPCT